MPSNEGQNILDTRALEIAVESRSMIMSHLKECENKNSELFMKLDAGQRERENFSSRMDSKFSSIYSTIDTKFTTAQTNLETKFTTAQANVDKKFDELSTTINRGIYSVLGIAVLSLGYFLIRFGLPGR